MTDSAAFGLACLSTSMICAGSWSIAVGPTLGRRVVGLAMVLVALWLAPKVWRSWKRGRARAAELKDLHGW